MSSSSSSDEVDERLDKICDEYLEETYNDIVEAQSRPQRRRAYVERNRETGQDRLWNDYFSEDATFSSQLFRRRFRMNKELFLRLVHGLSERFPFFQQRRYATGRWGLTALQKCTAAIRLLAYGTAADTVDEYLRLGETTALSCLHNFTNGIIQLLGNEYLRRSTPEDLQRLLDIGEARGFPRMVGSIDCMHWEWKNFPTAWKGTLNDINVLDRSPVFDDILQGRAPRRVYIQNGQHLSNLSASLKVLNNSYLLKSKKQPGKMWNGLLEYCKLDLRL
ncbi:uncharacterized protein LOC117126822 [Brassica rapa]|uniref:uncharacterized protein LOC117126822 n=1 Tax=Brassica campestris TaxID=3711 RepID=UPI00142DF576|nr:uncharacterized protein LOC117126822 [Brassica rapa]